MEGGREGGIEGGRKEEGGGKKGVSRAEARHCTVHVCISLHCESTYNVSPTLRILSLI